MKHYTRIYRFNDTVAINIHAPGSVTAYIDPKVARAIANELKKYADDVENLEFTNSSRGTVMIDGTTGEIDEVK